MKTRFPTDQRATWRERFLAIARQADAETSAARDAVEDALKPRRRSFPARSALRTRLASLGSH